MFEEKRFDPLILTPTIGIQELLHKIEYIGNNLSGYTEKLVSSFADIDPYRKVQTNLRNSNIAYLEWDQPQMLLFAQKILHLTTNGI